MMALAGAAWERQLSGEPLQNLTDLRKARHMTVGRLARHLKLPVDLLARLERGKVRVATIPERLIERLADALQTATSVIQAALLAPPPASTGARLNAEDGIVEPEETVVSFARAFADSAPTDEERAAWLMCCQRTDDNTGEWSYLHCRPTRMHCIERRGEVCAR